MKNNVQFITEEQAYRYMPNSSIEKDVLDNVRYTIDNNKFAGNFYSSSWQGGGDGYLYELDDYDGYVVGAQKLKEGEKIYRYFTRRSAVSGIKPLIKINIDKGLLYFLKPDDEDLDLIEFETKGIPVRYLNIIPTEKQEYAEGGYMAEGGSVNSFADLTKYAQQKIKEFPFLSSDIVALWSLAKDEIADGESEMNEVSLALRDINELIAENTQVDETGTGEEVEGADYYALYRGGEEWYNFKYYEDAKSEYDKVTKDKYDSTLYAFKNGKRILITTSEIKNNKYAQGGQIKWQDVFTGDGALVISENKMGYVVKPYGRRFHLRFPDGSEKTYSAEELEFYKDEEYAEGGMTKTTKNTKNNMIFDKNGERRVDPEALEYIETEVKMLPQTKFMHTDSNGKYSAKRKKLHEEIIGHFHEGKPCVNKRPAVAILTGGAPASGKTTFIKKYVDLDPDKVYHVDADEVRAMLPEYKGWNASQTHLETADIVNTLIDEIGIPCEHDLIYDGTMNKATKYEKIVDKLHKLGYKVFVIYISIPEQVSKERVIARYQKSGRYVPMGVIEEVYDNGLTAFEKVARDMADGYIRIDGMTGEVIEQGGIPMPKNIEYEKGGELDDDKYKNATALVRSAERYTEVETGEPVKKGMGMARASKKDGKMKYDSVVVFLKNGEQVVYDEDEFPKFFMKDGGELGSQDYYDGFQMQVVQKKGIPDKEVQKENTKMRYRKGGKL
jgi:predicted ABC-type ATPase